MQLVGAAAFAAMTIVNAALWVVVLMAVFRRTKVHH